jgi:hypothetical protein
MYTSKVNKVDKKASDLYFAVHLEIRSFKLRYFPAIVIVQCLTTSFRVRSLLLSRPIEKF